MSKRLLLTSLCVTLCACGGDGAKSNANPTSEPTQIPSLAPGARAGTYQNWYDRELAEFNQAKSLWVANGSGDYQFTFGGTEFGYLPTLVETTVYVADHTAQQAYDAINDRYYTSEQLERVYTVAKLFDLIERYIVDHADELDAEYHPTLGYPVAIFIDPNSNMYDDRYNFEITDFR